MTTGRGHGQHFDGDLRRVLLDAAIDAIGEHGVDAVSLRDVARRADVSHAAPAHHFGDKTGLYTAIAIEGFDLLAGALTAVEDLGDDPAERLTRLGCEYVRFAGEHPAHFEVMFRPALLRVDDEALLAAGDRAHAALEDAVAACRHGGWSGGLDTTTVASLAWGVAHGLGALRAQGALGRYVPDVSIEGIAALLRAFGRGLYAGGSAGGSSPPAGPVRTRR